MDSVEEEAVEEVENNSLVSELVSVLGWATALRDRQ